MIALAFLAALVIGVGGGELLRRRSSKPQRYGASSIEDSATIENTMRPTSWHSG